MSNRRYNIASSGKLHAEYALLLDTLIVRSFVVPSILRILGPWFWWPTLVRSRPLPQR